MRVLAKSCLLALLCFVTLFSARMGHCQQGLVPEKVTYIVEIDPSLNHATIIFNVIMNNTNNVPANGSLNVNHLERFRLVSPQLVVAPLLKEEGIEGLKHNLTATTYGNGTNRIYGKIWNISLRPYDCAYVSLRYKVKDILRTSSGMRVLQYSAEVEAKDVSYVVKLPKHCYFEICNNWFLDQTIALFRLNYVKFYLVEPHPSEIIDEGDHVSLVWKDTLLVKGEELYKFSPGVAFFYELNQSMILNLTATFLFALFVEQIIVNARKIIRFGRSLYRTLKRKRRLKRSINRRASYTV